MSDKEFIKEIYRYFKAKGRNTLPWRMLPQNKDGTVDPYKILVCEVMLQQTQAGRVAPKYKAFLKKFPTTKKLANATNAEVLGEWSGLGYNRRALLLKRAAEAVTAEHKGVFPRRKEALKDLPGIGPYTAGAVMAFAYNQPEVFIETNIRSVYIHFYFPNRESVHDDELFPIIERTLDVKNPRAWYAALMDYGAMLKATKLNPSRKSKHHSKQAAFKGSVREVRGDILRTLLKRKNATAKILRKDFERERFEKAVEGLIKEGMIEKKGSAYSLRGGQ